MVTARDILTLPAPGYTGAAAPTIDGSTPIIEVMHRLLASPTDTLDVVEGNVVIGSIDLRSCLEAMSRVVVNRGDTSLVELECAREDYSASRISHAVEDSGSHVTDIYSIPDGPDRMKVILRIRCEDPSAAIRSLERYGYEIDDVRSRSYADSEAYDLRIRELQNYLSI